MSNNTNAKPRGRPPKPTQGRGEIRADALYPLGVLLRKLGIARNTLTSLRRRGLPVHFLGRRCGMVDGAELIAFLRQQWKSEEELTGDAESQEPVNARQQIKRPDEE